MDHVPRTRPLPAAQRDGFSLVELLIVIVVLGILTAVVVVTVDGLTADAEDSACAAGERTLATAVESYFAQHGQGSIPATGAADGEEHERTLVTVGLIRRTSTHWNVAADGSIVNVSPC